MQIPEIPKTIRYDILLIFLGIFLIIIPFYLNLISLTPIGAPLSLIIGLTLLFLGIGYIKNDYDLDMDLKESEYIKSKYKLIRYFYNSHIITKAEMKSTLISLKNMIKKR